MSLLIDLTKTKPREFSGSSTSNRYDFQKDWGICLLLEQHLKNSDYLIFFDYHEDIVLLDSEKNPNKAIFFQIKTKKNGTWTVKSITKIDLKKGNPKSIIGKLYINKQKFPDYTHKLCLVSNVAFKAKLKEGKGQDKREICFDELDNSELDVIEKCLKKEYGLKENPQFKNFTYFILSDLSLNDHSTHTRGKIGDFIEKVNKDIRYKTSLIYEKIFDEVKRKTNYSFQLKSLNDLSKKAIGRNQFNQIINALVFKSDIHLKAFQNAEAKLNSDNVNIMSIRKFRNEFRQFEVKFMDRTNSQILQLIERINIIITDYQEKEIEEGTNLLNLCDKIMKELLDKYSNYKLLYSADFIKTVIMVKLYE